MGRLPQIAGLGHHDTARFYADRDAAEAGADFGDPLLSSRLRESVEAATAAPETAEAIFGGVDAIKLRSSLTVFAEVADDPATCERGFTRFHAGIPSEKTLRLLRG